MNPGWDESLDQTTLLIKRRELIAFTRRLTREHDELRATSKALLKESQSLRDESKLLREMAAKLSR